MEWTVEFADPVEAWWATLTEKQRNDMTAVIELLMEQGPRLPFPYSSGVAASRYGHMRELRVQSGGRPLRVFYVFDPRRVAVLLTGGDKTGDGRFYVRMVRAADRLYDAHLATLRRKGTIR